MQIHCLGTTGYHPSPTRHTACYYFPEQNLVLDAGTGLYRLTEQLLRDPKENLDIVLSHAHLDHVVGLTFLLDVMAVTKLRHVRVYGEREKLDAVQKHLFHPLIFPVAINVDFVPLETSAGIIRLPNCSIEYFPLNHPGGSIGMIVQSQDRRVAYVTDTTPQSDPTFMERLSGVDLLMHECYFSDKLQELSLKTGHSWIGAVTEIVKQTKPKQTLLIHINPLAEVLEEEIQLTAEQRSLGIRFAEDNLSVDL